MPDSIMVVTVRKNLGAGTYKIKVSDQRVCSIDTTIIFKSEGTIKLEADLYPTLVRGSTPIKLILNVTQEDVGYFCLYDAAGKLIYKYEIYFSMKNNVFRFDPPVVSGNYIAVFSSGGLNDLVWKLTKV